MDSYPSERTQSKQSISHTLFVMLVVSKVMFGKKLTTWKIKEDKAYSTQVLVSKTKSSQRKT